MKKRILAVMLAVTFVCGLCGCGAKTGSENAQSNAGASDEITSEEAAEESQFIESLEENPEVYTKTGSADWTLGTITINGDSITLPCTSGELEELGYTEGELQAYTEWTRKNGQNIEVTRLVTDEVVRIRINNLNGNTIDLDGVTFGMTMRESMDILGEYWYVIKEMKHKYLKYQTKDEVEIILEFDEEGSLFSVEMEWPFNGSGAEEVNPNKMWMDELEQDPNVYTEVGSDDWTVGTMVVNGDSITLPCTYEDIENIGYTVTESQRPNYNWEKANGQSLLAINSYTSEESKVIQEMPVEEWDKIDYTWGEIARIIVQNKNGNTVNIDGVTFGMNFYECMDILGEYWQVSGNFIIYKTEMENVLTLHFDEEGKLDQVDCEIVLPEN